MFRLILKEFIRFDESMSMPQEQTELTANNLIFMFTALNIF